MPVTVESGPRTRAATASPANAPSAHLVVAAVAVRDLAAFVHRRGDIHYRYTGSATAQEGIGAQRRAQPEREGYRREVRVAASVTENGVALSIRGRLDGIDDGAGVIEEYKATRSEVAALHAHSGHLHMAQLKLYAALINDGCGEAAPRDAWRLRLVYLHPDNDAAMRFEEVHSRDALADFFADTVADYTAWLAKTAIRIERRNACLGRLPFPFAEFRDSQRRLARGAYRAFRDREQLLVEAPTGSGKTAATVFSALRAIGHGALDRVVYLTARTTGKQSPAETLERCILLEAQGEGVEDGEGVEQAEREAIAETEAKAGRIAAVVLTAKRDICFNPDMPCDPACCRYASGYYDRMRPARDALLGMGLATREKIERAAEHHAVCPFELSLDAAAWADMVICDYNYVFDPVVRLERLSAPPFKRVGLLVDEAHQLGDRVRGMLSASLERAALKRALAEAPSWLGQPLRAVDRALLKLRRETRGAAAASRDSVGIPGGDPDSEEYRMPPPSTLLRAVERLLAAACEADLGPYPATREFLFDCFRFQEGHGWQHAENYCHLLAATRRNIEIRMVCLSPAEHIDSVLRRYNGAVRFSGTVSPLPLFQVMHGQDASSRAARVRLDWGRNLGVFIVPDVSTYYRDRAASSDALAAVVEAVTGAAPGNYLVAFPSFAYLDLVVPRLREGALSPGSARVSLAEKRSARVSLAEKSSARVSLAEKSGATVSLAGEGRRGRTPRAEIIAQRPGMTDAEKRTFIQQLSTRDGTPAGNGAPAASRIGAAVMGGMFAESVDFDGGALRGVIVVGVGLAPRSLERDLIGERFGADGFDVAYRQPGMTRVAQAAGRAVRGAADAGVVVLVDPRFPRNDWGAFFPPYWQPVRVGRRDIGAAVASFWRGRDSSQG